METLDLGSRFLVATVAAGALHVRLDRAARRNAITQAMYRGLKRAAILADGRDDVDVLVLTGTDDVFAVGGDMSGESEDPAGLAAELDPTEHFPFRHLEQCRKIVVAAVNGLCQAGGLNLLLHADVALASDRARFRAPELLRGLPDPWMAARLPAVVGHATAKRVLLTAAPFDAREALAMGLVARVVPHAALAAEVERTVEAIRRTAPGARAALKADLNRRLPAADSALFRHAILSPDMTEGFAAFFEGRAPRWPR